MMRIITVGQRKGGNGKSTSALNLAHAWAKLSAQVLLVDLDDQKNTTSAIEVKTRSGWTVEDLLLNPELSVDEVASATSWPGVSLVAASANLSGVIRELDSDVGSHLVLKEKLRASKKFNLIIVDTSPSLNILVVGALCASDWLLVPLSSKYFSLQGLEQTLEAYQKVKTRLNPFLEVLGLAFVIHDKRSSLACEVIQKAQAAYPGLVCQNWVAQNIKIEEAQINQQSIFDYAPKDRGDRQYMALARELATRMGISQKVAEDGQSSAC